MTPIVRQVAGTVRGLPAKAVLEGNQTEAEGRDGDDEVFHFRWGIPEGGQEEGVTRLDYDDGEGYGGDNGGDDDDDDGGDTGGQLIH